MNNLKENFTKIENILFNILMGTFAANFITLGIIYILQGRVPLWMMAIVIPLGIYYIVIFFVYIYRLIIYSKAENKAEFKITKSIIGLILSPVGLIFSFFNYLIIVLANIW